MYIASLDAIATLLYMTVMYIHVHVALEVQASLFYTGVTS